MHKKLHIRISLTLILIISLTLLFTHKINAQEQIVHGKVYAFKNLELVNIQVKSKKTKQEVITTSEGAFVISCSKKDKLIFCGSGFERTTHRISNAEEVSIKMIFKGGTTDIAKAVRGEHTSNEALVFAIDNYSNYNTYTEPYNSKSLFLQQHHSKQEQEFSYEFSQLNIFSPGYYSNINLKNYKYSIHK
ncbi:hypothetical protein [uncultured Draconibacterium sp.]|uniref:hypothetical protein n=1 Tax=uncultured Draconibacterium sp. TaxID=1573823 RepID=UPI00321758DC